MRLFLLITACLIFNGAYADETQPLYQVDLIVFTQQTRSVKAEEEAILPPLAPDLSRAVALKPSMDTPEPYHILPNARSQLNKEYWALQHHSDYQVLGRVSWLQPQDNQKSIVLPTINQDGWQLEGTVKIRFRNYYTLDTDLLVTLPETAATPFVLTQKQRMEADKVYYLDHPTVGMLIKIHPIT